MAIGLFNGICAIELDQCIDDEGNLSKDAAIIKDKMNTYTERTPGGTGLRILFKAAGFQFDGNTYNTENPKIRFEVYLPGYTDRCASVTGDVVTNGLGLEERSRELQEVFDLYLKKMPDSPIKKRSPLSLPVEDRATPLGEHRFDYMRKCDELTVRTADGDKKFSELGLENVLNGRYSHDSKGMAYLFVDCYFNECCYVTERGWHHYNGTAWRPDENAVRECAKEFTAALLEYAAKLCLTNKEFWRFVQKMQETRARENLLKDASSVAPLPVQMFDRHKHLLNCLNGTLNLLTRELRPHDPKDLITKTANVAYDPVARCRRWEQHVWEVFGGDETLVSYFQKVVAYSLTGYTNYEKCFICYGPTSRNGKTTTLSVILQLLGGEYGLNASPQSFEQKSFASGGSGASEDLARMAGARLVVVSEPEQRMVLANAMLKQLSGRNHITARRLYENSFEFLPEFKMIFDTNYLPKTSDMTLFKSGRICVIPFKQQFLGENQDKNLKDELQTPESLSGVLNWALDAIDAVVNSDFDEPPAVIAETADYERLSDKVGRFIDDTLDKNAYGEIPSENLYQLYEEWCKKNGCCAMQSSWFKESITAHGGIIKKKRPGDKTLGTNPRNLILGFSLKAGHGSIYLPPYIR